MYNNSRSLIMDSFPRFAMDNTFMIEGSFQTDFTAIKSSTTFNSQSSSPEADQQLSAWRVLGLTQYLKPYSATVTCTALRNGNMYRMYSVVERE